MESNHVSCSTDPPEPSIKPEPDTKEGGLDLFAQEVKATPVDADSDPDGDGPLTQDADFIGENGGVGAAPRGAPPPRQPRKRRLHEGDPWRLRLDYLVAHGPRGRGAFCMVCSQVLHEVKVSSFRRHIQECHPETTTLSRQEREAMAAAWTKEYSSESPGAQDGEKLQPFQSGFSLFVSRYSVLVHFHRYYSKSLHLCVSFHRC